MLKTVDELLEFKARAEERWQSGLFANYRSIESADGFTAAADVQPL